MRYFLDLLYAMALTVVVCLFMMGILVGAYAIGGPVLMFIVFLPAVMSGVALGDLLMRICP